MAAVTEKTDGTTVPACRRERQEQKSKPLIQQGSMNDQPLCHVRTATSSHPSREGAVGSPLGQPSCFKEKGSSNAK